jgi:secondary thiamine-phosphate synthase enzyme
MPDNNSVAVFRSYSGIPGNTIIHNRCHYRSLYYGINKILCKYYQKQKDGKLKISFNMKSYRKELWFEIPTRRAFVNITGQVEKCLNDSGIKEGLILVNAMHISASVFINDDESGLHQDFEVWLEKLAPEKPYSQYRHNGFEDNADAHIKRTLMGREVVVAVSNGQLDFGPWEQIFYGEFDGKRRKRVLVKIIGE